MNTEPKPQTDFDLPKTDLTEKPTGCCPRFDPEGWDNREIHFDDKLFVQAKTKSLMHVPINMGRVFKKTFEANEAADAVDSEHFVVLSHELSPWSAEHLFSVSKYVPGLEMVRLSGEFLTKVFEGPYSQARTWCATMKELGGGTETDRTYFFYTTCPKCAKEYGKNYVVGFVAKSGSESKQHEPAHIKN